MIHEGDCGVIGGANDDYRGNRRIGENLPQRHFVPPQIPHDQVRFRTPDHSSGKPATNRLSYGAAPYCQVCSCMTISAYYSFFFYFMCRCILSCLISSLPLRPFALDRRENPDIWINSISSHVGQDPPNFSFVITCMSGLAPQCFLDWKCLPSIDKERNYVNVIFVFCLLGFSGFCLKVALLVYQQVKWQTYTNTSA
jgi:hypothetical protein